MESLSHLLLAVLFAPLAFALIMAQCGRFDVSVVRRAALWLSVAHLLLTISLMLLAAPILADRKGSSDEAGAERFRPIAVPGDSDPVVQTNDTNWDLLVLLPSQGTGSSAAIQFYVGLDGLNVWLVLLSSLLGVIAVLVSWTSIRERAAGFYAWLFALQTAIIGAFISFDVILFYVFFELTLVPSFFLIGTWGVGGGKRDAARKFFLYTLFGGLLTLTGLIGIVLTNPTPLDPRAQEPVITSVAAFPPESGRDETLYPRPGPVSFSVNRLMRNVTLWTETKHEQAVQATAAATKAMSAAERDSSAAKALLEQKAAAANAKRDRAVDAERSHRVSQTWFFFLLAAGFLIKVPLVPFHTWLPAAYAEAPTGVVMIFSALMAKLGTIGFLRLVIPLAPDASVTYGLSAFGFLGAVGIVYAAFCAYGQRDLKMLAAYSSVSHLGLLVLGAFALNNEGLTGATLHMINHGLSAGALFALVGFLADRYRTTDSNAYSGLFAKFPVYGFLMIVISLASVGLPGLNNFVSEMMLMAGLFTPWNTAKSGYILAFAAASGLFLSAWYTFTMLRKVFFGPLRTPVAAEGLSADRGESSPKADVTRQELAALTIPVVLCLGLGLFPQPVLDTMRSDVAVLARQADRARARIDTGLAVQESPPKQYKSVTLPAGGNAPPPLPRH